MPVSSLSIHHLPLGNVTEMKKSLSNKVATIAEKFESAASKDHYEQKQRSLQTLDSTSTKGTTSKEANSVKGKKDPVPYATAVPTKGELKPKSLQKGWLNDLSTKNLSSQNDPLRIPKATASGGRHKHKSNSLQKRPVDSASISVPFSTTSRQKTIVPALTTSGITAVSRRVQQFEGASKLIPDACLGERQYSFRELQYDRGKLPPSLPLVLPNDVAYDFANNTLHSSGKQRSQLYAVKDTLDIIAANISKPLGVLSICGPYRTGKSYILSRMLNSTNAFALGHEMKACTFGIWIGTTIIEFKEFDLLLMDTEGIDATAATQSNDAAIFVLSILLSSYFIYNSQNVPGKSDLEKMKCFTSLTDSVLIQAGVENTASSFRDHFPDFMWLLRDVHLLPTNAKGVEIPIRTYLKEQVLAVTSKSIRKSASDEVASAIVNFFPSYDGYTLPPPAANADIIRNIETRSDQLEPKFNVEVDNLIYQLRQNVRPKSGFASGEVIDGHTFALLLEQYLKAVNNPHAIPCLDNAWQTAVSLRCKAAIDNATEEYLKSISSALEKHPLPLEEESEGSSLDQQLSVMEIHRQILESVQEKLLSEISHLFPPSPTKCEEVIAELEKRVAKYSADSKGVKKVEGGILYRFVVKNMELSKQECEKLYKKLYQPIQRKIDKALLRPQQKSCYTFDDLCNDFLLLTETYTSQAKGPAKWSVFEKKCSEFEDKKQILQQMYGFKEEIYEAKRKAEASNVAILIEKEKISKLRSQHKADKKLHEAKVLMLEKKNAERLQEAKENAEARLQQELKKQQELFDAQSKLKAEQSQKNYEAIISKHEKQLKKQAEQAYKEAEDAYLEEISRLHQLLDERDFEDDCSMDDYSVDDYITSSFQPIIGGCTIS